MSVSSVNTSATTLVAAQMTNITSEEKRNLLFDVNCSLEVQMEDFDENWWPLVSNIWTQWTSYKQVNGNFWKIFTCRFTKHRDSSTRQKENISNEKRRITKTRPSGLCHAKIKVEWLVLLKIVKVGRYKDSSNHTHLLLDVDRLKHPQVIRTLVEKEAVKNYLPLAITAAVKEYATIELGLGASAQELKRKEVTNIKYKVRGPMEVHLVGNSDLKLDISQSVSYLKEQGYQVEIYRVHQRSTKGIVFAHPEQLEKLENHGWLTLIDSTHKTNRYDWRLFTLAMHKRTRIGCEKLTQEAINNCPVPTIQNYIRRNYMRNTQQWALWACQHSPLLLQVTSTNPLESYHSELKRKTSSLHGLIGKKEGKSIIRFIFG
ncbi:hypothetical protein RhiirB3_476066 [Rhizophagus irregularis]|nr:hypothetical protein RhiirB3_476066 [Rhizophagus irregularis]